jgi:hypothetical protein
MSLGAFGNWTRQEVFTSFTHKRNKYHLNAQVPRTISYTPGRKDTTITCKIEISQQNPPDILCIVARAENTHRSISRLLGGKRWEEFHNKLISPQEWRPI